MHLSSFLFVSLAAVSKCSPVQTRQNTFTHPGIFVSKPQLDFVKSKLTSKAEPWTSAYKAMDSVTWAKTTWAPKPIATVRCEDPGTPEYQLEAGCKDERYDALAAYSMALRWALTGDAQFSKKAISIFDAWSGVLKGHLSTSAPEQVGLQSGWVGTTWARAAEIIRYTNAGWSASSIAAFSTMLRDIYLPQTNLSSVMLEATQGIAIFLDDSTTYSTVMARFKQHVPSYIYLEKDGAYPVIPAWSNYKTEARVKTLWQDDVSYFEGRTQESCRDLEHASYGIESISHMMETARIQGEDLYGTEMGTRLEKALEVHAPYGDGGSAPSWFCKGTLKLTLNSATEPAYNALVTRLGKSMPNTKKYTEAKRPAKPNSLFTAWETLTHAQNTA
ncbi:secreted protein [Melanomma pulvis-pyrius CBS 109.77]|uniref:Secreted protein n=1 Tax=Melanomma pulvis-pyrius CBS 109.77 TaxID=1314802 RepID=A0A6A6X4E6_9PLEO|nr:secreted protein [Melanomma pulvis-pyrius CBS 109.77]